MPETASMRIEESQRAFQEYNRELTVSNLQVGCFVGVLLMPAGTVLDLAVYRSEWSHFLQLRLLCSVLIGLFWMLVVSPIGQRYHRILGITLAMFPTGFMAWMIMVTDGASSPYYAGLNLVLLVVAIIAHWTIRQSFIAFALVVLMYLTACVVNYEQHRTLNSGALVNNLYFLVVTGLIVMVGSHYHSHLRRREFQSRFELDQSRQRLEESNRKLLEMDETKSRFFANVSHELRTPLTLLLAPLETLIHSKRHRLDNQARDWLLTMQANGMRLLKLINDLLDLVRIESGALEIRREPIELREFLQGLGNELRHAAMDKRVRLEIGVEPPLSRVLADRDKLEKVILNLLFNAIKFTPAGGRIRLRAHRQDDFWRCEVSDTGIGIAPQQLPFIFDRFWQVDTSSRRKYQGLGIGLALVKELVEAQGGEIRADSTVGQGTTIGFSLPFLEPLPPAAPETVPGAAPEMGSDAVPASAPQAAEAAAVSTAAPDAPAGAPQAEWLAALYRRAEFFPGMVTVQSSAQSKELPLGPAAGARPRILIADDEPDMLRFLRSQLETQFEVLEAIDGQQAIDKIVQFLPDLVLCDMMMPEKDGLQVCREIRERTATRNLPILILTARADERTKISVLAAGANDFLTKPFSSTELYVRLTNLMSAHEYERRLTTQNKRLEALVDQLKETEAQLVRNEKMASLGRLSAGIIHEINNPLNYVLTGIHFLKSRLACLPAESRPEASEILHDIEEGTERIKVIVSDLRAFCHPQGAQAEPIEVASLVAMATRFLSHEIKNGIQIELDLETCHRIYADRNRILQVLINLLQNSVQSLRKKVFPNGEQPLVWIQSRIDGNHDLILVRDNGLGIAPENVDKIFEPFFTTKDVGEGTGLGLSICYQIMREHHGEIRVQSEVNRFCEFALDFPRKETE
ncbi:MAG TPA: ATP-binding protein [Candidatus Paceibacterota bacterium]|nr:ATP-binding protein [Verrucomicrobiota bacterium]HRZ46232.1 ATP-binding protein [Candidatus Paceibacterota bacterium]